MEEISDSMDVTIQDKENMSINANFAKIDEKLCMAKINQSDIYPVSQMIHFTEKFTDNQYFLLELDKTLSDHLLKSQTLQIKGEDEETAVICTENQTYDLVQTETSNSLLLVDNLKFCEHVNSNEPERMISEVHVSGIINEYFEATPSRPRIRKLRDILDLTQYKGPEYEGTITEKLYSYDELLNIIQASKYEFDNALHELCAFTIRNHVRMLDFQYIYYVVNAIINYADSCSWGQGELDLREILNDLTETVPEEVLTKVFGLFAEPTIRSETDRQLYKFNEEKLAKLFAKTLLYTSRKFQLEEFLTAWQLSVPYEIQTSEDFVLEFAVIDRDAKPPTIRLFSEHELPDDVTERFKVLFATKVKWAENEITPFIRKLATERLDSNALLAKHARVSTMNGRKYYSSKHAK